MKPGAKLRADEQKLNSRPRKCLGFKIPYEVFEELTGIKQEDLTGYALMT